MKVSVIVPTLNASRFLGSTLDSISIQGNVECIVVDGGSTDDTLKIASNYGAKILQLPPKGEPDAINHGFEIATGDIFAWLDADDIYECYAVDRVIDHFVNDPDSIWCYGKCSIIDANGDYARYGITAFKNIFWNRYSYQTLKVMDFIAQPAVFFRREVFRKLGGLRTDLKYVFDYEYWLRMGKLYKPTFLPHYLASWRYHPGSTSVQGVTKECNQALKVSFEYSGFNPVLNPLQLLMYGVVRAGYAVLNRKNGREEG
jgi:glycosyltransferase involved in cell wall biosynthesis